MQAVFQAAETETGNAPAQLQQGHDGSRDDVEATDIDISEGIAAEMFGIPSSTEEVHRVVGFFCMRRRAIMFLTRVIVPRLVDCRSVYTRLRIQAETTLERVPTHLQINWLDAVGISKANGLCSCYEPGHRCRETGSRTRIRIWRNLLHDSCYIC